MSFQEEEMDYAAGDYEMGEVDENMYFTGRIMGDTESDEEDEDEYDHLVCSVYAYNFAYLHSALDLLLLDLFVSFCLWLCQWLQELTDLCDQDNKIADTSAAEARRGKDIQGIPWERLSISREKYRQTRLERYKNYENIPQSGEGSEKVTFSFTW